MFRILYEWMVNATFYLVVFTAVVQLLPNEIYQKYVRFFTGLVMILLILMPAIKVFGMERTFQDYFQKYQIEEYKNEKNVEEGQIHVEKIQIGG